MVILYTVSKWRHYLQGATFIIRTDQKSSKHLLEQRYFYATDKGNYQNLGVKLFHTR